MFQELAQVSEPERIGAVQSSATIFRFNVGGIPSFQGDRPFVLFDADGNPYQPVRNFNRATQISAFYIKPRGAGNTTNEAFKTEDIREVARAMLIDGLASRIKSISGGPVNYLTYGGNKLVRYELDPKIANEIGVPPFGSVTEIENVENQDAAGVRMEQKTPPNNLILYGPPGTGKTYGTAAEAVRLCGETVPDDRTKLMATYQQLKDAGRIEFVTFHQSMSYEDFVEGRQPVTGNDDDDSSESVGFRLEPIPGIFRRIAKRAGMGRNAVTLENKQIFKMSIGRTYAEEDAKLFKEAISGGYTLHSWEDIDWSDEQYAYAPAILEACRKEAAAPDQVTLQSGQVMQAHCFRNRMQVGDIIIVTKGNGLFRAIGEVTGEYEYHPRREGGYPHRRAVRWAWVDHDGVTASEIYQKDFKQAAIYQLKKESLNIPAIEAYMNVGQSEGTPKQESFVLIIDEINRANISKVFGELITLLEPDKRLGQPNALKVRLHYSGDDFGVPSNLHILGTMNTADRSIALLDPEFQMKGARGCRPLGNTILEDD
ncbi:MAG: AAA family ATPase [Alphaproteobacteria bacterium]|nr:AAA family ATPase [Alphaproteobacteria bacterium]